MQYRRFVSESIRAKRIPVFFGEMMRWGFLLLAAFVLGREFWAHEASWRTMAVPVWVHWPLVLAAVLLMGWNWFCEVAKWRTLAKPFCLLSWKLAFQGVLSGASLSALLPLETGNLAGRIGVVAPENRKGLVHAVAVSAFLQSFFTIFLGVFAAVFYARNLLHDSNVLFFLLAAITLGVVGTAFVWKAGRLAGINNFFSSFRKFTPDVLAKAWLWAGVRYLTFCLQFLLLLWVFEVELPVRVLLAGAACVFLAKSALPGLTLPGDLGLRGLSAFVFFQQYLSDCTPVLWATLLLWLVNLALPGLAGLFFFKKNILDGRQVLALVFA